MGGPTSRSGFQHNHRRALPSGPNVKMRVGYAHPLARRREARGVMPLSDYLEGESQRSHGQGGEQK